MVLGFEDVEEEEVFRREPFGPFEFVDIVEGNVIQVVKDEIEQILGSDNGCRESRGARLCLVSIINALQLFSRFFPAVFLLPTTRLCESKVPASLG